MERRNIPRKLQVLFSICGDNIKDLALFLVEKINIFHLYFQTTRFFRMTISFASLPLCSLRLSLSASQLVNISTYNNYFHLVAFTLSRFIASTLHL